MRIELDKQEIELALREYIAKKASINITQVSEDENMFFSEGKEFDSEFEYSAVVGFEQSEE